MKTRWLVVAMVALGGCAEDLQFRVDERVRFLRPPQRSEVTPPLVVEWAVDEPHTGTFGVFVDRTPMAPGRDLDSLAEDEDPVCARAPGCPNREWLREHGVILSEEPKALVTSLEDAQGRPAERGVRRHELTVVLLDRRGTRVGESAWTRIVYVRERR